MTAFQTAEYYEILGNTGGRLEREGPFLLEALAAARKALRENPRLSHLTSAERGEVLKYIANNDEVLNKLITATIAGEVVELLLTITI